jgi:hypothetical protein
MDLIERLFGISPDQGSGTIELIALIGAMLYGYYRYLKRRRVSRRDA